MNNALVITKEFPVEKYNLLIPMQTVAEISEIQRPVMNVVSISTNLDDKEIYEQEKGYTDKNGRIYPAKYAITKKGLTKLMSAAGIKIIYSKPVVPSTCQKCANVNAQIGRAVNCGLCENKDVKHEVKISVPQLTGENIEIVANKEIIVNDVVAVMSDKQKAEFLKFRSEMCESKALNRALRVAMQIKSTYTLDEFKKPFVVAYLVPNLDNPAVKEKAVESFFSSSKKLYTNDSESKRRLPESVHEKTDEGVNYGFIEESSSTPELPLAVAQADAQESASFSGESNVCIDCGKRISDGVIKYSVENFGEPLCMSCQRTRGGNQ